MSVGTAEHEAIALVLQLAGSAYGRRTYASMVLILVPDSGITCAHVRSFVDRSPSPLVSARARGERQAEVVQIGSGDDTAYLVPADMWRSISETAYLLRTPENAARLRHAFADADAARNRMDANLESLATA